MALAVAIDPEDTASDLQLTYLPDFEYIQQDGIAFAQRHLQHVRTENNAVFFLFKGNIGAESLLIPCYWLNAWMADSGLQGEDGFPEADPYRLKKGCQ